MPKDSPLNLPASAKVAVAMSGGVDSSVAAAWLAERGVDIFGITLALWPRNSEITRDRGCCSIDAVDDARRVATTLGIPHYTWNLEEDFERQIIKPFEEAYASGETPNPCVHCNQRVKFGLLLERALAAGATHLATGHYARVTQDGSRFHLHRAKNLPKDQSYTLHRLSQTQLSHSVFPLGEFASKDEVRDFASSHNLITAQKAESQELCFIDGNIREELSKRLAGRYKAGPIVDVSGEVVGEHSGIPFVTVGQRIRTDRQPTNPESGPWYVTEIRPETNTVVAGPFAELLRETIEITDCSWVSEAPDAGSTCLIQLRSHGTPHPANIESVNGHLTVRCNPGVAHVSPGQSMVLYQDDRVIGGGIVVKASS